MTSLLTGWRPGNCSAVLGGLYLDLCDLEREFAPGSDRLPPLLEGLDIDYLEKNWRQGPQRWALLALKK